MSVARKVATKELTSSTARKDEGGDKNSRRKILGGLPYTPSPGVLKRVLEKIPTSEKPGIFNSDFLGTVMGATGGSSRPIIPIFKSTGLLNQSSVPTELYSQFQTDAGRASAALQALKNGFPEIFRRNQYAHRADQSTVTDIIVSITGLPKSDNIVRNILGTFEIFQNAAKDAKEESTPQPRRDQNSNDGPQIIDTNNSESSGRLNLAYNINVILPETTNVEVYNAIFRSLKGNLLN